jgi:hypothetical protein
LEEEEDFTTILEKILPTAPFKMKLLLQSQYDALQVKDSRQRSRWDKDVIKACLNLWSTSPQPYRYLLLILPSGRQLQKYKNCVKQETGINKDVFRWMANVAKQHNIPPAGYLGGLIHDESRIQQDLVMNCKGKSAELIGWVYTGDEGYNIKVAKSQFIESALATEVFQISFLGFTGFRFPVAHYPTEGITATEIYSIIYDIISELQTWGFKVTYILQDGGMQNRMNYCSLNVVNPTTKIAHSQDFFYTI